MIWKSGFTSIDRIKQLRAGHRNALVHVIQSSGLTFTARRRVVVFQIHLNSEAGMQLAHHVYFTLNEASETRINELIEACKKYLNVQAGIVFFAVGPRVPDLIRDVNVQDWHVGLQLVFVDKAAHDAYQIDPTHNQFIAEMKGNWSQVRVYDSYV